MARLAATRSSCSTVRRGSGKSHLAAIWAATAHAWTVDAFEVAHDRSRISFRTARSLSRTSTERERDEAALFHLLNLARERRAFVLLTCEKPPDQWGLRTPDLLSRLRLAPSVSIGAPDDALLKAVLVKLFVDRQLVVDTSVVDYIALGSNARSPRPTSLSRLSTRKR